MLNRRSIRLLALGVCTAALVAAAGCTRRTQDLAIPPVATPAVALSHDRAPIGSPLDVTYTFTVADTATVTEPLRVFVHFLNADDDLLWTDDHMPPIPTTEWKPGQKVTYTRTMFVPIAPYVGEASIVVGLHSPATQKRVPLVGTDIGQRAYRIGKVQLLPQTENVFTVFKDGWHPTETAEHNPAVEWQWTKKHAALAFKNPKKDCLLYLEVDSPGDVFHETQHVQVTVGDQVVDQFTLNPQERVLRKTALSSAALGASDMVQLDLTVDKTFVPALIDPRNSRDPRELGIRVFHVFIAPR